MHEPDHRHAVHAEMVEMTERLVAEFAGIVPAATVIGYVARCREHLLQTGVRHGLVAATEGAVRVQLGGRIPVRVA
jgi:hypothetical protein